MCVVRCGCLALVAGVLAMAQGRLAGPGRYGIVNVGDGKWLQLDAGDRVGVVQMSPRPIELQRWDFQAAEGGLWFVRNAAGGCALEMPRNNNGEPVVCGRFDGNPNQRWRLDPAPDGSVLIRSRFGRPLDIPGGNAHDGVRIQIYDRNGGVNQRFQLRPVVDEPAPPERASRDHDRDRDHDGDREHPGRFFDDHEQIWKLRGDGACFYPGRGFHGEPVCVPAGGSMERALRDGAGSVRLFGEARLVVVFAEPGFRGPRYRIERNEPDLHRLHTEWSDDLGGAVGSFRVE
jgi:hypothetical protein